MSEFTIKTTRSEWQIVIQEHDQYGAYGKGRTVLSVHPRLDDAVAELPKYGTPHPYIKSVWIPKNETNAYMRLEVQYREVPIENIHLQNDAIVRACIERIEEIAWKHQKQEGTYSAGKKAGALECAEDLKKFFNIQ